MEFPFYDIDGNCGLVVPEGGLAGAVLSPPVGLSEDCCPCQTFSMTGPFEAFIVDDAAAWVGPWAFFQTGSPASINVAPFVQWSTADPVNAAAVFIYAFGATPSAGNVAFAGAPFLNIPYTSIETWTWEVHWCLDGRVAASLYFDTARVITVEFEDATDLFGTCQGFIEPPCIGYTFANNPAQVGVDIAITVTTTGPDRYTVRFDDFAPAGLLTDPTLPNLPSGVAFAVNCPFPDAPWKVTQEWEILEEDPGNPGVYDQPRLIRIAQACHIAFSTGTSGGGIYLDTDVLVDDHDYGCEELNLVVDDYRTFLEYAVANYGDGVQFFVRNASQLPWTRHDLLVGQAFGSYFDVSKIGFGTTVDFVGDEIDQALPTSTTLSCSAVIPPPTATITLGPLEINVPGSI